MIQIKCTLDNASTEINGIQFEQAEDGAMVSVPVEPEVADQFRGINGYELIAAEDDTDQTKDAAKGAAKSSRTK
jgi:hypothetical protein